MHFLQYSEIPFFPLESKANNQIRKAQTKHKPTGGQKYKKYDKNTTKKQTVKGDTFSVLLNFHLELERSRLRDFSL